MKVTIKIISPLIINSTDYINIPTIINNHEQHSVNMLDMESILMNASNRKELTNLFMEYFNSGNVRQIFDSLQRYYSGIPVIDNYKIYPEIEYDELDIKTSNISLPIGNYNGNKFVPYIPGSSIKGAIRNALRNNYIKEGGHVNGLEGYRGDKIDYSIFYVPPMNGKRQMTDDVMRFIEVSDFYPVNDYQLKIHKIVRTKSTLASQKIPAYAVALQSGEFKGNITINRSLGFVKADKLNEVSKVFKNLGVTLNGTDYDNSIKDILKITSDHYRSILNSEKNYYTDIPENPLALGFGGGIEQKTIITSLNEYDFSKAEHSINSNNKKIKLNNRIPSTHWEIDGHKFGVVDLIY